MNNEQPSRIPDIPELLAAIDEAKAELAKKT